jgi:hypothetical protein
MIVGRLFWKWSYVKLELLINTLEVSFGLAGICE